MLVAPPETPSADELLNSLIALRFDLHALRAQLGLSPSILLDLLNAPEFQSLLHAWREIESLTSDLRANELRSRALATLLRTLEKSTDPVELRRAATAILRASSSSSSSLSRAAQERCRVLATVRVPGIDAPETAHSPTHASSSTLSRAARERCRVPATVRAPEGELKPSSQATSPSFHQGAVGACIPPPAPDLALIAAQIEQLCHSLNVPPDSLDNPIAPDTS